MIICAGTTEQFDFAMPVGIGLIDAAIKLTELCIKQKPGKISENHFQALFFLYIISREIGS
jgi:hypothetical protein